MAVLGLLIGFTNMFHPLSNFTFLNYEQLNDYLYPGIGLVYLTPDCSPDRCIFMLYWKMF